MDQPETDGTSAETGDAGFTSPAFCPSQTTLFDNESLVGNSDEDSIPFVDGDVVITLVSLYPQDGVPYVSISIKWRKSNMTEIPLAGFNGKTASEEPIHKCVEVDGTEHSFVVTFDFDLVTSTKVVYSVRVCEQTPASSWCL